jgi:hypothetical protein
MKSKTNSSQDIREIKAMMERSTRFLSLSGVSGISMGIIALVGAAIAHLLIESIKKEDLPYLYFLWPFPVGEILMPLVILSFSVLILSLASAVFFSWRKARKQGLPLWSPASKRLLTYLFIPLIAGGFFVLILIQQNAEILVASATLIFYGLALVNAGKFTFDEIHYLGICEIILGILSGIFVSHGLLFWAIGFGLLHIIYGLVMYYRYER